MKKIIKALALLSVLTLFAGCEKAAVVKFSEETVVEYGSDMLELITETDADEITYIITNVPTSKDSPRDPVEVELNKEHLVVYTAVKGKKTSTHELIVFVVDTTPPAVDTAEVTVTLETGETINDDQLIEYFNNSFEVADNYDEVVELNIVYNGFDLRKLEDVKANFCDLSENCTEVVIHFKYEDTTAPVIEATKTEFSITAGNKVPKFTDHVKATDQTDGSVKVTVEGDYDTKTPGIYNLLFVAVDEAGNRSELPFTLTVKKSTSSGSNSGGSSNGNTGGSSDGGNTGGTSNNGSSGGNTGGNNNSAGETSYACPNAVYDKNKACDALIYSASYDRIFSNNDHNGDGYGACNAYGDAIVAAGTQPEGAYSFTCAGIVNNLGKMGGAGFWWNY